MPKRFTSTELWAEDWFLDAPNEYRLFWYFMLSKCNHAGLYKVNLKSASRVIGVDIQSDVAISYFNEGKTRVRIVSANLWLIEDFFVFQYGRKLNRKNRVHNSVLQEWESVGVNLGSIRGLVEDTEGVKDKDKDKDKDIIVESTTDRIYSVLERLECLKDLEGEKEKKGFVMLIQEMLSDFEKRNENYYVSEDVDFPALLQIAYNICKEKKWLQSHAVLEKKKEVIVSWNKILDFLGKTTDNRFYKLSLLEISTSKRFQSIVLAMRNANEGNRADVQAMICPKMISTYKNSFPQFPINQELDFNNCYEIAKNIAITKEWPPESIGNGKMTDVLDIWEVVVKFMKKHSWYRTRTLKDISTLNEWQRLVNTIAEESKPLTQQSNAAPLKRI